jgi:D-alanine-D-alanine ligase
LDYNPIMSSASRSNRIRIALLFGGKSAEHEVSLQSARNVLAALDASQYEVIPIGIDRDGRWYLNSATGTLLEAVAPGLARLNSSEQVPVQLASGTGELIASEGGAGITAIDVAFPILHGPMGEDGTMQGLLKLAGIPFVGADVLGSAVGMDKEVQKRLLRDAGLPITRFQVVYRRQLASLDAAAVAQELGLPVFVKPVNMGSSVGVEKVDTVDALIPALERALSYDTKALIEAAVVGREIEVAVLGNEVPEASVPGEVAAGSGYDFYSYHAKYVDESGSVLAIPASLSEEQATKARELAVATFQTLCLEGMARVDMFLRESDGAFLVNEVNTVPGFTSVSMYPKLWEASGLSYPALIDRLVELALQRHERDSRLLTKPTT